MCCSTVRNRPEYLKLFILVNSPEVIRVFNTTLQPILERLRLREVLNVFGMKNMERASGLRSKNYVRSD